jgi:uncharacterized protein (DUF1810 family)
MDFLPRWTDYPPMSSSNRQAPDKFDLQRFVTAQQPNYATVLAELRNGRKQTHWIWYVFPQVDGLGHSSTAKHYAIASRQEAIAYLADPLLGRRLRECTELVLGHADKTAHEIFGSPDDLKFRSSMTLFDAVGEPTICRAALERFYDGKADEATLAVLSRWP